MGAKKKKEEKQKPLDKMTAKELREEALKIEGISGVHGMNKLELIQSIKKAKGIKEEEVKKESSIRDLKKKIKELRVKKETVDKEDNPKKSALLKRRISKLKKRTRRT
ncbi:MAG: transcription termination factor Rho [Desulfobacterales bacterium]|nr:transcription termination factor Rho [Desulfobacterales bacterium]